jgi:hypothetical protein
MLPEDNEFKFDEMLKKSLKNHHTPIRDDFAEELLVKVEKFEQQRVIQKVVMQERLSMAVFILLPLTLIAVIIVFPSLIIETGQLTISLAARSLEAVIKQWQMLIYFATIALACLYAVYQMLAKEN